jgi:hypothetical protein
LPNDYDPTPADIRKAELAKPFKHEMDLAFFVVQIGMSPSEYYKLTEKEKMFIRKEHEHKFIYDTTWLRNAVLNAEANINRKKGKKFIDLFPKKAHKVDKEYNESAVNTILRMEKKGKSWVDRIFKANRIKSPKKGGN